MAIFLLVSILSLFQDSVPFKNSDEFDVKFAFELKQRPAAEPTKVTFTDGQREGPARSQSSMLPFLTLKVNILKPLEDERRIKVVTNTGNTAVNRKLDAPTVLSLKLGFTDDIKDRVSPHHFVVYFLSEDKRQLRKIEILFEEDGSYLVNGVKRGKI